MVDKKRNTFYLSLKLFKWARKYTLLIILTIGVIIILTVAYGGRVGIFKPIVDIAAKEKDWLKLQNFVLAIVGLTLIAAIFKYLKEILSNYVIQKITLDIRNSVMERVVRYPLKLFYDRKSGDLISRIINDVNMAQMALSFLFDDLLLQPFNIIIATGLIFWANWQLGLLAIVMFPIYVIPVQRLGKKLRKARKKSLEKFSDLTESMMQTYSGIKIVKAFNMEKEEVKEFQDINDGLFKKLFSTVKKKALSEGVIELFTGLGIAILILLAGHLAVKERMTFGDMTIFVVAIAMINTAVKELTKGYNKLQESAAGCERTFELLEATVDEDITKDTIELTNIDKGVEYKNVWFSYDTEPVLEDISFRVEPNEVIAVVGKSGVGKTTLVDLLCRFYEPTKGTITINSVDIKVYSKKSLLKHIAIVTQDPFLFNTTILENIKYGNRDASWEEIVESAKAAYIHDFIETLENGYNAVVGERGAKLSGGQKQRISIARAILKNPSILILDEATSSLDSESEKQVQEALDNLIGVAENSGQKRITFIIAHRLSTTRKANRIIVLDKGRIAEIGTHSELLERNGVYTNLYKMQQLEL